MRKTKFIVVGLVALIAAIDIWLALSVGNITISQYLWTTSLQHPVIPFAFGLLAGHLFWR